MTQEHTVTQQRQDSGGLGTAPEGCLGGVGYRLRGRPGLDLDTQIPQQGAGKSQACSKEGKQDSRNTEKKKIPASPITITITEWGQTDRHTHVHTHIHDGIP